MATKAQGEPGNKAIQIPHVASQVKCFLLPLLPLGDSLWFQGPEVKIKHILLPAVDMIHVAVYRYGILERYM